MTVNTDAGSSDTRGVIGAVVLAAGRSRRMGMPKLVLPWGDTTVIGRVVTVLLEAGVGQVVVVTGGARQEVESTLQDLPVQLAFNPRYDVDDMVASLKIGLDTQFGGLAGSLVALGDQPQIEAEVVAAILAAYARSGSRLVVPSYQQRRGHPWLMDRSLWPALAALPPGQTLRDFLNTYQDEIEYLPTGRTSVLKDLDTPEDYSRERP